MDHQWSLLRREPHQRQAEAEHRGDLEHRIARRLGAPRAHPPHRVLRPLPQWLHAAAARAGTQGHDRRRRRSRKREDPLAVPVGVPHGPEARFRSLRVPLPQHRARGHADDGTVRHSAVTFVRAGLLLAGSQLLLPSPGAAVLVQRAGVVEADTWVDQASPDANAGADRVLRAVDAPGSEAQTFLRVSLGGATSGQVVAARLRLQVDVNGRAGSDSGGNLHTAGCGWNEETLTWNTRPVVDPIGFAAVGAVQRRQVVEFDFTAALEPGRDVYCFALSSESPTFDEVIYGSREGKFGPPAVEVLVDEAPTPPPTTTSTLPSSITTTTQPPVVTTTTEPLPTSTSTTSTSLTTTTLPAPICGNDVAEPPLESVRAPTTRSRAWRRGRASFSAGCSPTPTTRARSHPAR
ncbi:MAG: DNRLRE domain-containing protein [Deltaproteobacteria bacterium]|nr:MAG: DNRLRE domain-containing protein [Deltaproteobacteria bacterium]